MAPAAALLLAMATASPAEAQSLDEAEAAYGRGDYAAAYRGFQRLAEQGDADAQFNLGLIYDGGRGVLRDTAEAARWYRRAAERGFAQAQFNLGFIHSKGRGVRRDFVRAHKWYSLAVSLSSAAEKRSRAARARDRIAARLTPAELHRARWLARHWRPRTGAARPPPPSGGAD